MTPVTQIDLSLDSDDDESNIDSKHHVVRSENINPLAGSSAQSAQLSAVPARKRKRALSITWHGDVPLNLQNSTKAVVLAAWKQKGEVGLSELSGIHTDRMDFISTHVDNNIVWRRCLSRSTEDTPRPASVPPTPPCCPPTEIQPILNAEVSAFGTRANNSPLQSLPLSAMELARRAAPVAPRPVARPREAPPNRRCSPLYVPERLLRDTLAEHLPSRQEVNWYQCDIASCRGWYHLVLKVEGWRGGGCHKEGRQECILSFCCNLSGEKHQNVP